MEQAIVAIRDPTRNYGLTRDSFFGNRNAFPVAVAIFFKNLIPIASAPATGMAFVSSHPLNL